MCCIQAIKGSGIRVTGKFFTFLVVVLVCIDNLGAAAVSNLKYTHHSPLVSALNGRSIHDGGGPIISGDLINSNRVSETSTGNSNSESVAGGNGVVGEVLAPKAFPLSAHEPTCEQLRAMWIFSKRQSRAAEISNEIPTYRDPFTYNIWEPYYSSTRSMGSPRMVPRFGERTRSPVFGRVISREPLLPQRLNLGQRQRHMGGGGDVSQTRFYGSESKPSVSAGGGRRTSQYRYVGANGSGNLLNSGSSNPPVIQGSFQKLKELIWTERAKELTQQRRAEEMAARAAVLKEIANGQNIQALYKAPSKSESYLMDENRSPDRDSSEHLNDDHLTGSIASGQSQVKQKIQHGNNLKTIGTPRSYASKAQKSSSIFSGNGGARNSGSRSMVASFVHEDTGIPKAYPIRPSHFRERNRSLFKQNAPSDYFQRDIRQGGDYSFQEGNMNVSPITNRFLREHPRNEINQRITEKKPNEQNSFDGEFLQENVEFLPITNYDYDPLILAFDQYTEPQERSADYLN